MTKSKEKWARVVDYPDYFISTKGRVWSTKNNIFLKQGPADKWGHLGVGLSHHGKRIHKYIHRLMGEAFLPNPDNLPVVRHLNDVPDDNVIENLAWGTWGDNTNDAIINNHFMFPTDEHRQKALKACRVPIRAINLESGEIIDFDGVGLAARSLNICRSSISKVLCNERSEVNGWTFEYSSERNRYHE